MVETGAGDGERAATRRWVERSLRPGHRIIGAEQLRGGWTSRMRRLDVEGDGERYSLVLRSFVKPFHVKHAPGLLTRAADILRLLADTDVPAARLRAVDAAAEHCDHPSLLMFPPSAPGTPAPLPAPRLPPGQRARVPL